MEFEKDLLSIKKKVVELTNFSKEKGIDLSDDITRLKNEYKEKLEEIYKNLGAWDKVQVSRHPKRPYTFDYIEHVVDDFVELHGDRLGSDDPSIITGIGKIGGQKIAIIGNQKGREVEEKVHRNFGMATPDGYRKALRIMKLAERFNMPIITLIDTPGAYPGLEAEKRGQGEAIARNLLEMAGLKVPTIAIVIGEGGSGGALALGVSDKVFLMENSVYSVISPEGCAAILFKDSSKAPQAAENLKMVGSSLLELNVIDGVIKEPLGGAHRNHKVAAENLKEEVIKALSELKELKVDELLKRRYNKFREMGAFN